MRRTRCTFMVGIVLVFAFADVTGCSSFGVGARATNSDSDGDGDGSVTDASSLTDHDTRVDVTTGDGGDADPDPSPREDSYKSAVLADQPIGYWRLDEATGNTASDSSGNGVTGDVSNVTFGAQGAIAKVADEAGEFSGGSSITFDDKFDFAGRTAFTIEAWIAPTDTSAFMQVFSHETNDENNGREGYALYVGPLNSPGQNDGIGLERYHHDNNGPKVKTGILPPSDGTYTYVVGTYDGGRVIVYVNGVFSNAMNDSTSLDEEADKETHIGAAGKNTGAQHFFGKIDEVAIYDKALSPLRIARHYSLGHDGP